MSDDDERVNDSRYQFMILFPHDSVSSLCVPPRLSAAVESDLSRPQPIWSLELGSFLKFRCLMFDVSGLSLPLSASFVLITRVVKAALGHVSFDEMQNTFCESPAL
jgi:hypothetical protein